MTPKEKAEELIDKMDVIHYMKLGGKNSNSKGLPISMHDSQVKQCALIVVDEILNEKLSEFNQIKIDFWLDVRNEINKL